MKDTGLPKGTGWVTLDMWLCAPELNSTLRGNSGSTRGEMKHRLEICEGDGSALGLGSSLNCDAYLELGQ